MNMIRKSSDKSWQTRPPGVPDRTSAGGIVLRQEEKKILVALIREGTINDYVLPKGKVEKGETIEQAAAREIEEEAGIRELEKLAELGSLSRLNYKKNQWVTTHYFLYITTQVKTKATDKSHDYETHWFDLDQLPPMYWAEQRELIEKNRDKIKKLLGMI
jgi:8-oxo-dGTP pyrophosphatase MutT (NUDIX family)